MVDLNESRQNVRPTGWGRSPNRAMGARRRRLKPSARIWARAPHKKIVVASICNLSLFTNPDADLGNDAVALRVQGNRSRRRPVASVA